VGANTSAVRFHNITGYCQTKSKAIISTSLNWPAPKTIEDAWQKLLANTVTRIGNGDLRTILFLRATKLDTTA